MKFRKNDAEKVAFGLAGLAGGTLAMKTVEKVISSPTVKGLVGFEGVATLQEIAPSIIVGLVGTTYFAKNRTKNIGFIGLGAAMAAGTRVVDKVTNKNLFSGLGSSEPEFYLADKQLPVSGSDDYLIKGLEGNDMGAYALEDDQIKGVDGFEGDDEDDDYIDGLEGDDEEDDYIDGLEGDEDDDYIDGFEGDEIDSEYIDGFEGDEDDEDYIDGFEGDEIDSDYIEGIDY